MLISSAEYEHEHDDPSRIVRRGGPMATLSTTVQTWRKRVERALGLDSHAHLMAAEIHPAAVWLELSSPSFYDGMAIPERHAGHTGVSPALSWSGVPPETKQLALLCEDPDATTPTPYLHWAVYGIPLTTKSLAEGIPPAPVVSGFKQGRNSSGGDGYIGADPPLGDGVHHIHFQLFALDAPSELAPGADRASLLRAMTGHVLAAGDLVGTYEARRRG
jgi:Raf kinase inhibitor-like YbhB/YbcL family protein